MSPEMLGLLAFAVVTVMGCAVLASGALRERRRILVRFDGIAKSGPTLHFPKLQLSFRSATALAAGIDAIVGFVLDGVGLAIVFAAVAVVVAIWMRSSQQRKRLRNYDKHLLRVLDAVVLSVKSGSGLVTALREAAQAREGVVESDLREVIRHIDFGVHFESALAVWTERCSLRSIQLTVASLTLAYETGGSSASTLSAVRQTVRNALVAENVARTHAAQSKASAIVLACLPVVLSGPMLLFNHSARTFMLHTPVGIVLLLAGVGLDLAGLWWMSKLIDKAQA